MTTQIKERNGIRVGETYWLWHSWKGIAVVKPLSFSPDSDWLEVKIVDGVLTRRGYGGRDDTAGDVVSVQECDCTFSHAEKSQETPTQKKHPVTITHDGTTLNLTWRESASLVSSLLDAILDRKPCAIEV